MKLIEGRALITYPPFYRIENNVAISLLVRLQLLTRLALCRGRWGSVVCSRETTDVLNVLSAL